MESVLCLDAGQTGVRAEVRCGGEVVACDSGLGIRSSLPVLTQLTELVTSLVNSVSGRFTVTSVGAGISGLGADADVAAWLAELPQSITGVYVGHDSITSYLGALGDQPGAVVANGTGSVTLAVGPQGITRVDGWGHLLGDDGSGFWIGRQGLALVMRAFDGRSPQTSLTNVVKTQFPDLAEMYLQIQQDPNRVARIASYARLVSEHAAQGDPGCQAILDDAGMQLAASANAGLRTVGLADEPGPAIGLVGMVFESALLRGAFERGVSAAHPKASFVRANQTGLNGAAALTQLRATSPLRGAVLSASR